MVNENWHKRQRMVRAYEKVKQLLPLAHQNALNVSIFMGALDEYVTAKVAYMFTLKEASSDAA